MKQRRPVPITGQTRIVAILGDPVGHSRSPEMHNAAFRALRLDWVYVAFAVRRQELRTALRGIRSLGIAGLNVTVPHKETILPLLDDVTPRARSIGAVNTVYRRKGELVGENTDATGFLDALAEQGISPKGKTVLVLGAGGSARAVVAALVGARAGSVRILNRTRRRAASLRRRLTDTGRTAVSIGPLRDASDPEFLGEVDLVVNCTSIGLDGRSVPPLRIESTRPDCVIHDLVYGPRGKGTPLVRLAARKGRCAEDGRSMLLHQAARAFRLWTGRKPPLDVMARTLGE